MSDGVTCYRRMSAPMGVEELEEAAGLLRDAAGSIRSAVDRMHYMEVDQFGSVLRWCHQSLSTVSARLGERAEGVRDHDSREEFFELRYLGERPFDHGAGVVASARANFLDGGRS